MWARNPLEDSLKVEEFRRRGWKLDDAAELTHSFDLRTFPGNEPPGAVEELKSWGLSASADEEVSGDGYWHITARGYWELPREGEAPVWRQPMEALAARHGLVYSGWDDARRPSAPGAGRRRLLPPTTLVVSIGIVAAAMLLLLILTYR